MIDGPLAKAAPAPPSPRPLTRAGAAVGFAVLCVSYMVNAMDRQVFYPLLPEIRAEFGFSLDQGGLLATGFTLGMALVGLPTSYLMDRIGRRSVLVLSVVVYSLGTLAIPFAAGFADMGVYRLLSGVGEGMQATALYAVIGAYFFHRRAVAAGVVGVAFGAGVFLGPLIGNGVAGTWGGWRDPFYVFAAAGLGIALLITATVSRTMTEAVTGSGPGGGTPADRYDHVPAGPCNRNTLGIGVVCAVTGLVNYGFLGLYPTFLREHLGLGAGQAALAVSCFGFGAMMALPAGWLGDRVNQRLLLAVGFVATSGTAALTYQYATSAPAQYALAFLMGTFASGILFTNCTTAMQRAVRPELVGRGSGLFMLTYYVPAAFSGLLFARLVDALGWGGAGLWQLTVLPLLGLAGLALVDTSRMVVPNRASARGR
ncbi:MFS transporter [Actinacidiphila glaucinigra]|uniref:Sugar phosphate permease n=1 Tax=Actinacidiphila glaucinigra TaxID=235986 RepID=A0A239MYE6_9ACTN|nr:MFS transporter [Actinacidiphila glaucinigra]SNT47243.1 Sugar phosphate permease [Actinacidiphila glaucinigra]